MKTITLCKDGTPFNKTLGVLYGLTPQHNIFNESNGKIDWSEEKCAGFIEKFFTVYPGLSGFIDLQHRRCTSYGLCWDAFGRPRLVPEGRSCHIRVPCSCGRINHVSMKICPSCGKPKEKK